MLNFQARDCLLVARDWARRRGWDAGGHLERARSQHSDLASEARPTSFFSPAEKPPAVWARSVQHRRRSL